MAEKLDTISFMSDYGTADEFVGVVKSVVRSIAPHVTVVDVTHELPPYNVKAGGLTLARSAQYLCPGVVLAVVDPGVGTNRRAVAIEVGDGESYLVGPDNGLLAPAVGMVGGATAAVELNNPDYQLAAPGPTFAGRDIFAPAAAHLCAGVPLAELGDRLEPATLTPGVLSLPREEEGTIVGEVYWVDRYGNCQLNVGPEEIEDWGDRVQVRWTQPRAGARTATRAATFEGVGKGQVGLIVDSYGLLAVAVAEGSAADLLGLATGDEVILAPLDDEQETGAGSPGADTGTSGPDAGSGIGDTGVTSPVTLGRKPR